jgi:hypothetical protein
MESSTSPRVVYLSYRSIKAQQSREITLTDSVLTPYDFPWFLKLSIEDMESGIIPIESTTASLYTFTQRYTALVPLELSWGSTLQVCSTSGKSNPASTLGRGWSLEVPASSFSSRTSPAFLSYPLPPWLASLGSCVGELGCLRLLAPLPSLAPCIATGHAHAEYLTLVSTYCVGACLNWSCWLLNTTMKSVSCIGFQLSWLLLWRWMIVKMCIIFGLVVSAALLIMLVTTTRLLNPS